MAFNRRQVALTSLQRYHGIYTAPGYTAEPELLQANIENLEKLFEKFTLAQDELINEARNAEVLEAHTKLGFVAEKLAMEAKAALRTTLQAVAPDRPSLPFFDGQPRHWLAFKNAFEDLVHSRDYPEAYKKSKLLECIPDNVVPLDSVGYHVLWESLKKRYDSPRKLAEVHIHELLELVPLRDDSQDGLLHILKTVTGTLHALRVLGLPVEQWDAWLVPTVTRLLPPRMYQQWALTLETEDLPSLKPLLAFLEKKVHRRPVVAPAPIANGVRTCPHCAGPHTIQRCKQYTRLPIELRETVVRRNRLCHNCLANSHRLSDCQSVVLCKNCNQRHHSSLCRRSVQSPNHRA